MSNENYIKVSIEDLEKIVKCLNNSVAPKITYDIINNMYETDTNKFYAKQTSCAIQESQTSIREALSIIRKIKGN